MSEPPTDERARHRAREAAAVALLQSQNGTAPAPLGLAKRTSNLFRDRAGTAKRQIDLRELRHVLEVDPAAGWVDAEGLTTYETLVDATLPRAVMPAVVPQLKTITAGGAVAGVGIEATSFREGLVHDTMLELDVLLPDGEVVRCTPENEHRDLFFGFPNSYGTLGYALRVRLRTLPVKRFVRVEHRRHATARAFFEDLGAQYTGNADFVDGAVFGPTLHVLSVGRFVDEAPAVSDYTYEHVYYRSLTARTVDFLTAHDYLWRWDTDWFWCSKNVGAQNPIVRRLLGRRRLNSRTYTRLMRLNARWGIARRLGRLRGLHPESVIQDVDIPLARAADFLEFELNTVGILPLWICPLRAPDAARQFPLYPLRPATPYVNFGFWDVVATRTAHEAGHFNRLVEREVLRLGGIKSLYSDSFFSRDEFAAAYGMSAYERLKARYDPRGRMLGLYEKCVLRA